MFLYPSNAQARAAELSAKCPGVYRVVALPGGLYDVVMPSESSKKFPRVLDRYENGRRIDE